MNANRISWFYDFKGASMNVDTACSSSLVALDLACQELRSAGSNMVLCALVYFSNCFSAQSNSAHAILTVCRVLLPEPT